MQKNSTRSNSLLDAFSHSRPCNRIKYIHISILPEFISGVLPLHGLENLQLVHSTNVYILLNDLHDSICHLLSRIVTIYLFSIEYHYLFKDKYIWQSIYIVAACVYYVAAIPLSHYCYRVFKSHSGHPFLVQPMRP